MDPDRQRIQDDLRGRITGEVFCDPPHVQLYSTDASIYAIDPLGVVRPKNVGDVIACMEYAAEHRISLHARGSGTGQAGGCLGGGLVIDFSRFMCRTLQIGDDWVRVQPGVVLARLNRTLATRGRIFGPDPYTSEVSTLGGVVSVDGSGSHWPRYGAPRHNLLSLQVVLTDGSILNCRRPDDHLSSEMTSAMQAAREAPRDHEVAAPHGGSDDRTRQLSEQVRQLYLQNAETLANTEPKTLVNSSGYNLYPAAQNDPVDMTLLLAGSEGTLGMITEATFRTYPLPPAIGVVLLFFDRLDKAAHAALDLREFNVAAGDLMDRRLLRLARESDPRYDVLLPENAEAMLLVELDGENDAEVRDRLRHIADVVGRKKKLAFDARIAIDRSDVTLFWKLAQHVVPTLYRISGSIRPVPFVEDMAVPPESLPDFLVSVQNILKRHQVTASYFAHATHGQLHLRPFIDLQTEDSVPRLHHLARDLYRELAAVHGTLAGEHGDGICRSWYAREQSPARYHVMQQVKRLFDPRGILNPGKVADDVPISPTAHLRLVDRQLVEQGRLPSEGSTSAGSLAQEVPLELEGTHREIFQIIATCNGCGRCRTTELDSRMCPMFRILPAEEASPRSKANLLRGIFHGTIDRKTLASDDVRAIADLCFNCQQCRQECPAGVDIPRLVLECKAQHVRENGLRFGDWWLARLDLVAPWLMPFRTLVNTSLRSRRIRWLVEKVTGISARRKLPSFEGQTFLQWAARRQLTRPTRSSGPKVVYFADLYANIFDIQLAEATIATLHHNGIWVYVPPRQVQSGMTLIAAGALLRAKELARQNLRILADAVRQGYQIVASEPSAVLCLTQEYPRIVDEEDAQLVAENTWEACTYLWNLHQHGNLELDFSPLSLSVGYHVPCHLRALGKGQSGEQLLRLIPGLTVKPFDRGCSGMAGTWGLKASNFRRSLRIGWPLIQEIRKGNFDIGATECSTCKMQMEQGTHRPTVHPLKLLAYAYGLMPQIETLIQARRHDLVIS